jgi:iron(III) transport system ATP-binding protein
MKSVRIEKVSKLYGAAAALDDVSLDVGEGEIFFLLGPSGCGKTTLLRIIAGLTQPSSGRILIDGRDITDRPSHLRQTAMVFQNYALWPHMTVAENVQFAMTLKRVDRKTRAEKTLEALRIVHMEGFMDKKPAHLSGGEQQRVALARAVAADPQCLLLDEPLSNLDASLRTQMRSEIRRICKQTGITTIYVTHDQKEALSIADRIAVLHGGRVEQVGSPGELYSSPATKFVAGFVGETNFISATVEGPAGDGALLIAGSCRLRSGGLPDGLRDKDEVTLSIRPEKFAITSGPGERPDALEGRIGRMTFLGELTQYEVETKDAGSLKVIETTSGRPRKEGETVFLAVDPQDIHVFGEP